jgi:chemosensory pili system protein ChpA (sensor histidine kinase/response regulator)
MRDDVDALIAAEAEGQQGAQAGTFDRLADNLGALSFLIDMLSVQPQMAKSLFRFDPAGGYLLSVMDRAQRPSGFGPLDAPPALERSLVELAESIMRGASNSGSDLALLARDLERLARQAEDDQRGVASAANKSHRARLQQPPMRPPTRARRDRAMNCDASTPGCKTSQPALPAQHRRRRDRAGAPPGRRS